LANLRGAKRSNVEEYRRNVQNLAFARPAPQEVTGDFDLNRIIEKQQNDFIKNSIQRSAESANVTLQRLFSDRVSKYWDECRESMLQEFAQGAARGRVNNSHMDEDHHHARFEPHRTGGLGAAVPAASGAFTLRMQEYYLATQQYWKSIQNGSVAFNAADAYIDALSRTDERNTALVDEVGKLFRMAWTLRGGDKEDDPRPALQIVEEKFRLYVDATAKCNQYDRRPDTRNKNMVQNYVTASLGQRDNVYACVFVALQCGFFDEALLFAGDLHPSWQAGIQRLVAVRRSSAAAAPEAEVPLGVMESERVNEYANALHAMVNGTSWHSELQQKLVQSTESWLWMLLWGVLVSRESAAKLKNLRESVNKYGASYFVVGGRNESFFAEVQFLSLQPSKAIETLLSMPRYVTEAVHLGLILAGSPPFRNYEQALLPRLVRLYIRKIGAQDPELVLTYYAFVSKGQRMDLVEEFVMSSRSLVEILGGASDLGTSASFPGLINTIMNVSGPEQDTLCQKVASKLANSGAMEDAVQVALLTSKAVIPIETLLRSVTEENIRSEHWRNFAQKCESRWLRWDAMVAEPGFRALRMLLRISESHDLYQKGKFVDAKSKAEETLLIPKVWWDANRRIAVSDVPISDLHPVLFAHLGGFYVLCLRIIVELSRSKGELYQPDIQLLRKHANEIMSIARMHVTSVVMEELLKLSTALN
jgi:hypothetical protein